MSRRTVFVSHAGSDESWAKLTGDILEEMGHSVLAMYKGSFHGNYGREIDKAIAECDDFFFVLSPRFEKSSECQEEWSLAHKKEKMERKKRLHPIRVESYTIGIPSIALYDFIDLSRGAPGSVETRSYLREEIAKILKDNGHPGPRDEVALNNLPARIPNFTGRKQIIDELHRLFTAGSREQSVQVLTGLGGVGKTKISLEYAYSYLTDYRLIWFLHAEDKTILRQEVSGLAKVLYPGDRQENIDLQVAAVRRYLENNDRWLLIFDNATAPEDIDWLFPAVMKGNIIVTSRNPNWGILACPLSVRPFSKEESVEFMEKRLHRTGERHCFQTVTRELECIPIILEIAAAYMETSQINCGEYRDILKESADPLPLTKVWGPSFTKIREGSEKSIALLQYLSCLSPDTIPEEVICPVLVRTPDLSDYLKNKTQYLEVLSLLLRYSFVSKDIGTRALSMHRIVQKAVQAAMDEKSRKETAAATVKILSGLFPIKSDDPETIDREMWAKCYRLLPHAIHAAGVADGLQASPIASLHLYAQIASFLRELDNLKEAEEFARKSVSIAAAKKETVDYAIALETLARILRDQGRDREAQDAMLEAIRIEEDLHKKYQEKFKRLPKYVKNT